MRVREVLVRKSDVGDGEFDLPDGWELTDVIDFNAVNWKVILTCWRDEAEDDFLREQEERFALT